MAKSVFNLTRNCYIKKNQALSRIDAMVAAWVQPGISIRELPLNEVIALRSHQREISSGLEPCEVHGCKFLSPVSDRARLHNFAELKQQARKFYNAAIQ